MARPPVVEEHALDFRVALNVQGLHLTDDQMLFSKPRWKALSKEEREKLAPICPDFVIELRSPSDRLTDIQEKMDEYMASGARMAWLLDPFENCAWIYRSGQPPEQIMNPSRISGHPVLPDLNSISLCCSHRSEAQPTEG